MTVIYCIGLIQWGQTKFISKLKLELELSDGKIYRKIRGKKVYDKPEYFVKRAAYENVLSNGKIDWWYDNNKTDIIKISKYGKKQISDLNKTLI